MPNTRVSCSCSITADTDACDGCNRCLHHCQCQRGKAVRHPGRPAQNRASDSGHRRSRSGHEGGGRTLAADACRACLAGKHGLCVGANCRCPVCFVEDAASYLLDDVTDLEGWERIESDEPPPDLGPCCACGGLTGVRNVYMLHQRSPMPGRGWGCLQCGLPNDGAIAVVCDDCHRTNRPLRDACRGWPADDGRIPIEELAGTHEHVMALHPEAADA